MKRKRAIELVEEVLVRLDESKGESPLIFVSELHVFGSFARGALEPSDIDINFEISRESPDRWRAFVRQLPYPPLPETMIARALRGGRRSIQMIAQRRDDSMFDNMTLLWQRGDTLEQALERLRSIQADPTAGRAPRSFMLPEFEGFDKWMSYIQRQVVSEAVSAGALRVERFDLPDGRIKDGLAQRRVRHRWKLDSPLYRAASAAVSHFEERGINPESIRLHGRNLARGADTPYFVGFNLKYLRHFPHWVSEYGCVEYIDVVHPTAARPLATLKLVPLNRTYFDREINSRWLEAW